MVSIAYALHALAAWLLPLASGVKASGMQNCVRLYVCVSVMQRIAPICLSVCLHACLPPCLSQAVLSQSA